ncbi:hypothetical protein D3C87_1743600 [compost metagenome]
MQQFFIGQHFCVNHQRRTAMTDQLFNGLTLFLFVVVAIANQQKITGLVRHLFYCFYHRPEKGVRNVADH